jgi:hypothetical protein
MLVDGTWELTSATIFVGPNPTDPPPNVSPDDALAELMTIAGETVQQVERARSSEGEVEADRTLVISGTANGILNLSETCPGASASQFLFSGTPSELRLYYGESDETPTPTVELAYTRR